MLPPSDNPEAFGQHSNADIASQIQETRLLFDTLLSLQPQIATGAGESKEDKVWLDYIGETCFPKYLHNIYACVAQLCMVMT